MTETAAAAKDLKETAVQSIPVEDGSGPPKGFFQASGDIVAYWEPASPGKGPGRDGGKNPKYWYSEEDGFRAGSPPILFTPLDVTLSDSKIEAEKTSTLLFGRLERKCRLKSANEEEGYKEFEPGVLIGMWTKPGMRPLGKLSGTRVWMRNGVDSGEKDGRLQLFKLIKKNGMEMPSPMVQFDIHAEGPGKPLPVREDRRDKSLPSEKRQRREQAHAAETMDDIPF